MAQDNVAAAEITVARRQRRGGTLICIMGIDGSGKTTQAGALAESLRAQGVDAVHAWARWKPILMLPARLLGRALARRGGEPDGDYRGFTDSKRAILRGRFRSALWKSSVLLDHAWQVFFKIRIPLMMGKTVVADRYVYDTLVDLSVNLRCPPDELLKDPLLRLFPGSNLVIVLDLSPHLGVTRKRDGTPEAYLAERRALYLQLGSALRMETVDAEGTPTEVQAEIRKRVWKRLGF